MVAGPGDHDGIGPDDLPTEAVPSWPASPKAAPQPGQTDDVWAMTAPGADLPPLPPGGQGQPTEPTPQPTRVMPVTPAPPPASPPPPPPVLPLSPSSGDGEPPGRKRGWIIGGVVAVVAVIGALVAIVLVRDDESTTDRDRDISTTTEMVPTTTPITEPVTVPPTVPPTDAPTTTEVVTTTTEETTTTLPGPVWPSGLRVAVAAADGVHVVQGGSDEVAVAEQVSIALALPSGGFLVQDSGGRYDQNTGAPVAPGATAIRFVGVAGGVLLAPVGEQWLTLHDLGTVDGSLVAVVSIGTGSTIEDQEEELVLVPVNGGVMRSIGIIGGWEAITGRLHLGGRGIVGESFAGASSGPLLLTVDGNQLVDPAALGLQGEYFDCANECPHFFATDPSGSTIGWIEDATLVVVNATNGRRVADIPLPAHVADRAVEIELLPDIAIVNRLAEQWYGDPLPPVVVNLSNGELIELGVGGIATATRG